MTLRHFRIAVIIRTIALALTLGTFLYLILETPFAASGVVVGIIVVLQVLSLIRYVEKTNMELARFLRSVKYDDFSQSFSGHGKGRSFDELGAAFSQIIRRFRETRTETEEQHQYLQTVIQHIGVGLIAYTPTGNVTMLNTAAKRLLHIGSLKNIEALDAVAPGLSEKLKELVTGKRTLVKLERENELVLLAVYATEFRLREQQYTLVSLQNIRSELEEKEMESYQKLIRVLTHEIMNSVTPISSLASSVDDLLRSHQQQIPATAEDPGIVKDVREAVGTIKKRSAGLLHFVEAYRNLTRVPKPRFRIVSVSELLDQVEHLIRAQHTTDELMLEMSVDPTSLEVTADPELIEQVLLNLILNALHAVKSRDDKRISVVGSMDKEGHVILDIQDNGHGIPEDVKERIFVPFFTTKKEGSGIGLSLCKEIMRLHRGTIHVFSEPEKGSTFRLVF